jgi:hypothetical protein
MVPIQTVSSFEIIAALVSNFAQPTVPGDMVRIQVVSSFEIIAALATLPDLLYLGSYSGC